MKHRTLYPIIFLFLLMPGISLLGQERPAPAAERSAHPAQEQRGQEATEGAAQRKGETVGSELAKASREAAGEEEENAEFKHSTSVKMISRITGMSLKSAYWFSIVLNFAILAALIVVISKSKLPAMFRTRTGEIQRGISEARKASENANRRLADIEGRLAKLDAEVASMKVVADEQAVGEAERIRHAAEEEKRKILQGAEAEITAAVKMARRELKAYSAELAVSLAEKRIDVDAATDRALVGNFVAQLNEPGAPGGGER